MPDRLIGHNASSLSVCCCSLDGNIKIDVRLEEETVWLTQGQMAILFGKAKSTINEHIKNVYEENELQEIATKKKFGISAKSF